MNKTTDKTKPIASLKYVVYSFNSILDSVHQSLERVEFNGWVRNEFNSEDEAINALIEDDKTYENFVILKQVILRRD